jgi:hypothetical protein
MTTEPIRSARADADADATPDLLEELGLLAPSPDDPPASDPAETRPPHERRRHPRYTCARPVRLVMLNGDEPLGSPFTATMIDASRTGMRITGHAPLLSNARAALELTNAEGKPTVLGATIRHSTFGALAAATPDNAATAGIEFHRIPAPVVAAHFTATDGTHTIEPDR